MRRTRRQRPVYFKNGEFQRHGGAGAGVKLRPEHATTHYQLSQVFVRLNLPERAEEELKLYAEFKTKAEEARSAASRLLPATPQNPDHDF